MTLAVCATIRAPICAQGAVTATATPYGQDCSNVSATATPPLLGSTCYVSIHNAPTPITTLSVGASRTSTFWGPLPMSLAPAGMPNCWLLQSHDLTHTNTVYTFWPNVVMHGIDIPNQTALLGVSAYIQAISYAPTINYAGAVTSNGVTLLIGNQ